MRAGKINRYWWVLLIVLVAIGSYFYANSLTFIRGECEGYCDAIHPERLQQTKAICEANLLVSDGCFDGVCYDDINSYGVRCTINAGCIECRECALSKCVEAGPCTPSGTKTMTCLNECDGDIFTKTISCNYVPPDPDDEDDDDEDECDSNTDCDDRDPGTKDECVKVGTWPNRHYECRHTDEPYYEDMIMCNARSFMGIDNAYEWRENTVEKCAIPIVNLICHEESDPYCAMKPDILMGTIVVITLAVLALGTGISILLVKSLRR